MKTLQCRWEGNITIVVCFENVDLILVALDSAHRRAVLGTTMKLRIQ